MSQPSRDIGIIRDLPFRRKRDLTTLLVIAFPHVGILIAFGQLLKGMVGVPELVLLFSGYLLTMLGMTLGYHRLLAHRSLETSEALTTITLGLGAMAGMGPPVMWVANHRRHHALSDAPGDPHSPREGMLHAHVLWLFRDEMSNPLVYAKDLLTNRAANRIGSAYYQLLFLGILVPGLVASAVDGFTVWGLYQGILWGGLVRIALNQHATWSLGSLAHASGKKAFQTQDDSRNSAWLSVLMLGEGWHNNHHAFPSTAFHGFAWHQLDVTGLCIKALGATGLAWKIRGKPSDLEQEQRKLKSHV